MPVLDDDVPDEVDPDDVVLSLLDDDSSDDDDDDDVPVEPGMAAPSGEHAAIATDHSRDPRDDPGNEPNQPSTTPAYDRLPARGRLAATTAPLLALTPPTRDGAASDAIVVDNAPVSEVQSDES